MLESRSTEALEWLIDTKALIVKHVCEEYYALTDPFVIQQAVGEFIDANRENYLQAREKEDDNLYQNLFRDCLYTVEGKLQNARNKGSASKSKPAASDASSSQQGATSQLKRKDEAKAIEKPTEKGKMSVNAKKADQVAGAANGRKTEKTSAKTLQEDTADQDSGLPPVKTRSNGTTPDVPKPEPTEAESEGGDDSGEGLLRIGKIIFAGARPPPGVPAVLGVFPLKEVSPDELKSELLETLCHFGHPRDDVSWVLDALEVSRPGVFGHEINEGRIIELFDLLKSMLDQRSTLTFESINSMKKTMFNILREHDHTKTDVAIIRRAVGEFVDANRESYLKVLFQKNNDLDFTLFEGCVAFVEQKLDTSLALKAQPGAGVADTLRHKTSAKAKQKDETSKQAAADADQARLQRLNSRAAAAGSRGTPAEAFREAEAKLIKSTKETVVTHLHKHYFPSAHLLIIQQAVGEFVDAHRASYVDAMVKKNDDKYQSLFGGCRDLLAQKLKEAKHQMRSASKLPSAASVAGGSCRETTAVKEPKNASSKRGAAVSDQTLEAPSCASDNAAKSDHVSVKGKAASNQSPNAETLAADTKSPLETVGAKSVEIPLPSNGETARNAPGTKTQSAGAKHESSRQVVHQSHTVGSEDGETFDADGQRVKGKLETPVDVILQRVAETDHDDAMAPLESAKAPIMVQPAVSQGNLNTAADRKSREATAKMKRGGVASKQGATAVTPCDGDDDWTAPPLEPAEASRTIPPAVSQGESNSVANRSQTKAAEKTAKDTATSKRDAAAIARDLQIHPCDSTCDHSFEDCSHSDITSPLHRVSGAPTTMYTDPGIRKPYAAPSSSRHNQRLCDKTDPRRPQPRKVFDEGEDYEGVLEPLSMEGQALLLHDSDPLWRRADIMTALKELRSVWDRPMDAIEYAESIVHLVRRIDELTVERAIRIKMDAEREKQAAAMAVAKAEQEEAARQEATKEKQKQEKIHAKAMNAAKKVKSQGEAGPSALPQDLSAADTGALRAQDKSARAVPPSPALKGKAAVGENSKTQQATSRPKVDQLSAEGSTPLPVPTQKEMAGAQNSAFQTGPSSLQSGTTRAARIAPQKMAEFSKSITESAASPKPHTPPTTPKSSRSENQSPSLNSKGASAASAKQQSSAPSPKVVTTRAGSSTSPSPLFSAKSKTASAASSSLQTPAPSPPSRVVSAEGIRPQSPSQSPKLDKRSTVLSGAATSNAGLESKSSLVTTGSSSIQPHSLPNATAESPIHSSVLKPGWEYALPKRSKKKNKVAAAGSSSLTARAASPSGSGTSSSSAAAPRECVICLEQYIKTVLVPCGHTILCPPCGEMLMRRTTANERKCPVCRQTVTRCVETFGLG
ncbi:hypothetical protein HDU88_005700 [Geranomyces variabilis]|nr:hypothetical protein HDU88_005700 [Geranomyces variabilis]